MADAYELNLLRHLASSAFALVQMQTARDLFQKPYAALSPVEQKAVHTAAFDHQAAIFDWLNPETLAAAAKRQAGFHSPAAPAAKTESTPPEAAAPETPARS